MEIKAIKVRVARKASRETFFKNKRKTEIVKLFLQDGEGSMVQATLFNEQIDKFTELLESGKCYLISKGNIRPVNKKFDNMNDKIEISFTNATKVDDCLESFPLKISKSFVPFNEVEKISKGQRLMDILGMVIKVRQAFPVPLRGKDKTTMKREVTLLDLTGSTIKLELWGDLATSEGDILESMITLNPLIAVSNVVLNKYEVSRFFSSTTGWMDKISGPSKKITESKEVKLANITGNNVDSLFCTFVGRVGRVLNKASPWYEKCIQCSSRVHPRGNEKFAYCKTCDNENNSFTRHYLLKLRVSDGIEEVYTTLFDAAEAMIGCLVNTFAEKMLTVMDQDKYLCLYYKNLVLTKGKTFKFLVKMDSKKAEDRAEKRLVVEEVLKIASDRIEKSSSSRKRKLDP
ncbi:hypothetical protein ACS0TY_031891 [Phlomoides rotata]